MGNITNKSAVKWIVEQLRPAIKLQDKIIDEYLEKALQMERYHAIDIVDNFENETPTDSKPMLSVRGSRSAGKWDVVKNQSWSEKHVSVFGNRAGYVICHRNRNRELVAVASVIGMPFVEQKEIDANANLIAAAPDLYEALIALKNWVGKLDDWRGIDPPVEIVDKAIEKATLK
ncbi:hypothetical protein [Aquirufa aurantiipilula]